LWDGLGQMAGGPVIAMAPGGGANPGMALESKRWPAVCYAALGRRLVGALGATIVLVGGPGDARLNAEVAQTIAAPGMGRQGRQMPAMQYGHKVPALAGETSFGVLGSSLRRCDLFVGNDSAPMHLAAAVGCPVVALFGPTNPAMYAPYTVRAIVVRHDGPPMAS